MPPPLALLLCTIFVLYLWRYDRRASVGTSKALWVPTIWMLCIASKGGLAGWFGGGGVEAGSPLDRAFFSALLVLGVIIALTREVNWSIVLRENAPLVILMGYMLLSIIWSDFPYISFKRWTRALTAVVMAIVVFTERNPTEAMQSLLRRTVYALIPFSILVIKYFPAYGVQYHWSGEQMWIGVTAQKNSLGRLCITAIFFLVWTLVRRWKGRDVAVAKYQTYTEVFLLGLTLYLLKGADSATAIASLVIGLSAYIGLWLMERHGMRLPASGLTIAIISILALGVITPILGGSTLAHTASLLGRDETLTGRTDIWAGLLSLVSRAPFLGSGFEAFWTREMLATQRIGEAHNGYLEVLLHLGVIGLLLTAMFLISCGRKAQMMLSYDFDWGSLCICILLMALTHNITESSINSFTTQLTAVVLFLSVALPQRTALAGTLAQEEADLAEMSFSRHRPRLRTLNNGFEPIGLVEARLEEEESAGAPPSLFKQPQPVQES